MTERDLGGQCSSGQELLLSIKIGQHRVQQARALRNARFDRLPFLGGNEIRQWIENPRTVSTFQIGIHIVSDAVLDNHAPREFGGAPGGSCVVFENPFDQGLPMASDLSAAVQKLVVAMRIATVIAKSRILIDDFANPT